MTPPVPNIGDTPAVALVASIRAGDVAMVERLVSDSPVLASSPLGGEHGDRTPLHVVTDWPGYWRNGPDVVRVLINAGADPNARNHGVRFAETPLHWAASSDDEDVARALIDGGADVDAADGSIGTPLGNAVGYACFHVARLLVARGARVDQVWHAAALGLLPRLKELLAARPVSRDELSQAFWHACSGGQRRAAEYLHELGADVAFVPSYAKGTCVEAALAPGTQRDALVSWLRERVAR